jgi:hypothetical protein
VQGSGRYTVRCKVRQLSIGMIRTESRVSVASQLNFIWLKVTSIKFRDLDAFFLQFSSKFQLSGAILCCDAM